MRIALPRIFKTFLAGVVALGATSTGANAQLAPPRPTRLRPPPPAYSVRIEDQSGNRLRTFRHQGRVYVLGDYGTAYQVHIENKSGQRVEAVISVDGRDAVSGNVADYTTQRGYVIAPYDSVTISGFRESFDDVRQFRFTNPAESYSALRGTPQYLGVVGVAFFPERTYPTVGIPRVPPQVIPAPAPARPSPRKSAPPRRWGGVERYEYRDDVSASASASAPSTQAEASAPRAKASQGYGAGAAADSARASAPSGAREEESRRPEGTGNLGTEYGERSYSPVQEVNFSRQDQTHPRTVMRLYYDDENGLLARGIDVNPPAYPQPYAYSEPDPFPATRFAPPP